MTIISAHREPDELIEWTRGAESRGIKVMIAGAGMAAALPGMCAALFSLLPVIGVLFRKESGWNGCSVFNHADAAGSSGCNRYASIVQRMQQFLQQRFLRLQMKNFWRNWKSLYRRTERGSQSQSSKAWFYRIWGISGIKIIDIKVQK